MTKNTLKYLAALAILVILGLGALYFIRYLQYQNSPERQAEEFVKAWERAYREDTYGGITPEETLQLFIDALKKGDTDLAAKYFLVDDQEKWRMNLLTTKENNKLELMIEDLENLVRGKTTNSEVFFVLTDKTNTVTIQMIIGENPYTKKWKIFEM